MPNSEATALTVPATVEVGPSAQLPANVDPERLLAAAIEHKVPIETLERLLALRERLKAEQARAAFFDALSAFQGECPVIPKTKTAKIQTGTGGSYTYSYAPLEVIVARVSPILRAHGLSTTFDTHHGEAGTLAVICTVHHLAGHAESSTFKVPVDEKAKMNDAQKVASASTYARRYAFCNALGIMTGDDDDDGHSGGTREGEPIGGGPADFGTPPRKVAPPRQDAKPPTGPVQGTLPGKPDDAITDGKVKRVYALIKEALKANSIEPSTENVATVEAELDRIILASRNRAKWQWVSWRGADYQQLCDGIEPTVARLFSDSSEAS